MSVINTEALCGCTKLYPLSGIRHPYSWNLPLWEPYDINQTATQFFLLEPNLSLAQLSPGLLLNYFPKTYDTCYLFIHLQDTIQLRYLIIIIILTNNMRISLVYIRRGYKLSRKFAVLVLHPSFLHQTRILRWLNLFWLKNINF